MNPGKMKNRIAVYSLSKSADGYGGFTAANSEVLDDTIWGYVKYLSGEYIDQSGSRQKDNKVEVIVRKKSFDLLPTNEFTFKIDGSASYRINDVYESEVDKYVTIIGSLEN